VNVYELLGGPMDGEQMTMNEEHMRVGIPFMCDNGCCFYFELYDWTEESDKKGQLYYAGRESVDEALFDAEYQTVDDDHADYMDCPPQLLGGAVDEEDLWDIWEAIDPDNEDNDE
jgi:hypothetical protein